MKRFPLLLGLCCVFSMCTSGLSVAQDDGLLPDGALPGGALPGGAVPAAGLKILEVGDTDVATLRGLGTTQKPNAISLGISRATLQADAAAFQALASWVRDGGVVFLHTDAAQLFGYQTVQARQGTPQLAGQLYGRARNALPFGAHPLLWSGVAQRTGTLPTLSPSSRLLPELGVQIVYYQLNPGDALAVDHPAAVPLLRVTDMAATTAQPLYAAAIAPFGNGWAVFTPSLIEQNRADGAAFAQNLLRLVSSVGPSPFDAPPVGTAAPAATAAQSTPSAEPLVGISGPLIETLSANADAGKWPALLAEWQKATTRIPAAFMQPAEVIQPDTTPRVLIARSEAAAIGAGLAAAAQGGNADSLRTFLYLVRSRLEYQRGQTESADEWLAAAEKLTPNAAEVLLWRGVLAAGGAQNLLLSSQERALRYNSATQDWTAAAAATPLVRATTAQTALAGIPLQALNRWTAESARAAQLMSVEPPLVTAIGNADSGLVMRHFANDPTLRLALPSAAFLSRSDAYLGWHLDSEEILIFPSDQYYAAYSQAARLPNSEIAFNPLAQRANVLGNRILMVSQITLPVLLDPGPPPRYANLGVGVAAVLGRLHAQAMVNALALDGTRPPGWMQLGLMSLSNIVVTNDVNRTPMQAQNPEIDAVPRALRDVAAAGGLLSSQQFEAVNLGTDRSGMAEAQARRMMLFFYRRFGSGAVIETLQRLGSGENIDEALTATTGLDEARFFLAWRDAEFGR